MNIYLLRDDTSINGTFGHWCAGMFQCFTLEPPKADNDIVCIPAGIYTVKWEPFGKYKGYAVKNVPGRTAIEIHGMNTVKDTLGCIGLGLERGERNGSVGIWRSREAIERFSDFMNREDFTLEIIDRTQGA